ncbi:PepSY domain-containing protein [Halomonas sp. QHL1]|uniref:PepSY domain-containing protein n=1 Tax=Halomonas sp. QHL1 TaxID=1123773 RepID=UPI0008FD5B90|nr:hypothetical protein QHL1GM_11210 [Halomonas sp. QHL1]
MEERIQEMGHEIKEFEFTESNCYEIYGWNEQKRRGEIYFYGKSRVNQSAIRLLTISHVSPKTSCLSVVKWLTAGWPSVVKN